MSETAAKKDVQKLQRVIVDALEDVKAQDIQVFNTEHLSPLFERVVIASGTSNRQTKALSASVRDKVREAGYGKPRIEGEDNGEWIIADCGAAVVHIMQPVIRQYYRLEEIWGDKPVRLKFGAPKPVAPSADKKPAARKAGGKTTAKSDSQSTGKALTPAQAAASARKASAPAPAKAAAGRKPALKAPAPRSAKPAAGKPSGARKTGASAPAKSASTKKVVVNAPRKPAAKKAPAKSATRRQSS